MPAPLSVDEALARILDGVAPMPAEAVAIEAAHGRTLAEPLAALLTQPPFDASAMDGYAVRAGDVAKLPATLAVIGEAAAGIPSAGRSAPARPCASSPARRCRTAPTPSSSRRTRRASRATGRRSTVRAGHADHGHVRTAGLRFPHGDALLDGGRRLGPRGVAGRRHGPRDASVSGGRWSPSSPPATSCCRRAAGRPGPDHLLQCLGVPRSPEAAGARCCDLGIARDRERAISAHGRSASGEGAMSS